MKKAVLIILCLVVMVGCFVCNKQVERTITLTNHLGDAFADLYILKDGQDFKYTQAGPAGVKTNTIPDGAYTWNVVADNTLSGDMIIDTTGSITISGDMECVVDSSATQGCFVTWSTP
jgi:hypothetical protein